MRREDHLEWLTKQRADYEAHQASSSSMPDSMDFAVGADQYDESEPVYRSLSFAGPMESSLVYEEEPVYRSIDLGKISEPEPSAQPAAAAAASDATWVAQKRPPLLRRQNAFAFNNQDPSWLTMLDQTAQREAAP